MCRVVAYAGNPILLEDILYKTDNSLITQTYNPKFMSNMLNLAGFGMAVWSKHCYKPDEPYIYKTPTLPFFDLNLKCISKKLEITSAIAHIRGVDYTTNEIVNQRNLHPFRFRDFHYIFAHNGLLANFNTMRYKLLSYIKPEISQRITGTTDSEWIYSLIMSQLKDPCKATTPKEMQQAIFTAFEILDEVRREHSIHISSPLNIFISDGTNFFITRFVLNYGHFLEDTHKAHLDYHSLWYTFGNRYGYFDNEYKMKGSLKKKSIIFASEPLTEDTSTWIEIPEGSLLIATKQSNGLYEVNTIDIDL